ncbi:MAG: dihydrodipicolinate synthase family protein [Lachnospiraceae bacterium]|nr:dihydrodipicolinate synthase family protein [Lachnospiraceae bacterium]
MEKKRMKGVVIPMITPMNEDGSVDYKGVESFSEYLINEGVDCLYPNGTNGESLLLTAEERQKIAEVIVKTSAGRIPVFIQCGAMSTAETAAHARHAVEIGADGIGIMTPAFFTMDEESLFQYYCDVIGPLPEDFPVYIYNIPGCTGNDLKPELLCRLMKKYPNIAGIKYSNSDLMRVENYILNNERKPDVLIGCDSLFLQCLAAGGVGTVTGPGAIFCRRFNRLYKKFCEGDLDGAMKAQQQIVKTDRDLEGIPGIPALKTMLKMKGVISTDVCRKPLRALTAEECKVLDRAVKEYEKEED